MPNETGPEPSVRRWPRVRRTSAFHSPHYAASSVGVLALDRLENRVQARGQTSAACSLGSMHGRFALPRHFLSRHSRILPGTRPGRADVSLLDKVLRSNRAKLGDLGMPEVHSALSTSRGLPQHWTEQKTSGSRCLAEILHGNVGSGLRPFGALWEGGAVQARRQTRGMKR